MTLVKVQYKGATFSQEMAHAMIEADRLTPDIPVVIVQGGFNGTAVKASAGTHAGDAADVSVNGLTMAQIVRLVLVYRTVGMCAWYRPPNWDNAGGAPHIHMVPNGWGYPSAGAAAQAVAYRAGRNGLANARADNGPGGFRTRTWGGYLKANALTLGTNGRVIVAAATKPATPAPTIAPPIVKTAAPIAATTTESDAMDYATFCKYMDAYAADLVTGKRGESTRNYWAAVPWWAVFGHSATRQPVRAMDKLSALVGAAVQDTMATKSKGAGK